MLKTSGRGNSLRFASLVQLAGVRMFLAPDKVGGLYALRRNLRATHDRRAVSCRDDGMDRQVRTALFLTAAQGIGCGIRVLSRRSWPNTANLPAPDAGKAGVWRLDVVRMRPRLSRTFATVSAVVLAAVAGLVPAVAAPTPAPAPAALALDVAAKIRFPVSRSNIKQFAAFTIRVKYRGVPLDPRVAVQRIITYFEPLDPTKVDLTLPLGPLDSSGEGRVLVEKGLPRGNYRICTSSVQNPLQVPGTQEDCEYFVVNI
ncbi:hypothetical protein ABZX92_01575 [Lentzea sp. NPDC006480]|uniref:hypothetical protein n=1 Tax=Lentzea sp. NPDC006480 TaxID=3157176 RepID=UPI0033B4291D